MTASPTSDTWKTESREDRVTEHLTTLRETAADVGPFWSEERIRAVAEELADNMSHDTNEHLNGIPWHDDRVHLKGWRGRFPFHVSHKPQTRGQLGLDTIYRCRCGAIQSAVHPRWTRR